MKPFPQIVSILSVLAAVFGALNTAAVLSVVTPQVASLITVAAVVTAALSHSLTGSGGAK